MGALFLHQLHDHLKSLRFQLSLLVVLLFFAGNGVIYAWKMERLSRETASIAAQHERQYADSRTLRQAVEQSYQVLCPALGTEFMAEGGFNWFADAYTLPISQQGGPPVPANLRTTNNWMRKFDVIDWAFIVRIALSFLCIVLAYDAVGGEAESGTLRLVLANPLARGRFLAAKFLAHLAILLVTAVAGGLLSLLILSLQGAIVLDARLLQACLLFLLGTALYLAFFLSLSLAISALARTAAASLVLLVMAWAVLVVLIPQSSYLVGVRAVDPPENFWEKNVRLMEEARQALANAGIALRGPEAGRLDRFALEQRYTGRLQEAAEEAEQNVLRADEQLLRRYRVARSVNLISPGFAFQYSVEALLGTGLARRQHFFQQARRYRQELREFFRQYDAADPDSPHVYFLPAYMSARPLDPALIPRFREAPLSFGESLETGLVPLLVLALEAGLAGVLALWAFNRLDLTA